MADPDAEAIANEILKQLGTAIIRAAEKFIEEIGRSPTETPEPQFPASLAEVTQSGPGPQPEPRLYTVQEVATFLHLSERNLRDILGRGTLEEGGIDSYLVGGARRLSQAQVDAFLEKGHNRKSAMGRPRSRKPREDV